jgi:hypothetical protein
LRPVSSRATALANARNSAVVGNGMKEPFYGGDERMVVVPFVNSEKVLMN